MSTQTTQRPMGIAHPGVLDAFAYDGQRDMLILAMYETREWNSDEQQIFQLQEKLNAYASFILDGEMAESFPQYRDKKVEIQLRTRYRPDPLALGLLQQAQEQFALQQIGLETIQIDPSAEELPASQPGSCGCGGSSCC